MWSARLVAGRERAFYRAQVSLSNPAQRSGRLDVYVSLTMARCRHYDNVAAVAPPSPPSVNGGGAPRRPKRRRVEDDDDVISALPDDILIGGIVSRLTIRDAAATGAVSARWRHLWKHAPRISLRPTHLTGGDVSSSRDYAQADRLAAAASSVLRHHRGAAGVVEMLVLALPLTPSRHAAVLGQSVEFAASSRTQELHLSLAAGGEHPYDFPQHWRFAGGRLRRLVLSDLNNNEGASSADAAPPHPRRAWREHVASVASLLVAAPFVKELRVEAYGDLPVPPPSKQMIQWPKHCSPKRLESIVVGGFSGEPELMELAFFLLQKSPAIKTLTVDTHRRHFRSNDRGWTREETEDPVRCYYARGVLWKHLAPRIPSTVKLTSIAIGSSTLFEFALIVMLLVANGRQRLRPVQRLSSSSCRRYHVVSVADCLPSSSCESMLTMTCLPVPPPSKQTIQ
ncbi:hypothetical protein HU200_028063 [Digitaria exilis]|uniref:F-box domain-containing protein n=1 Tax=Digitaria exilis TaxID=1010633 RepID=A0A835BWG6_9POAL|nr:hypothetical protein HU200_028063 [Digitaria exilis]